MIDTTGVVASGDEQVCDMAGYSEKVTRKESLPYLKKRNFFAKI